MQDYTAEELQANVSPDDAEPWLAHALNALYADTEHRTSDGVVYGLSFEELIGALVASQLQIKALRRNLEEMEERYDLAFDTLTSDQLASIEVQLRAITAEYL